MDGTVIYNAPHFFGGRAAIPWDIFIVLHFFLSGLAAGAFITSAAASMIDRENFKKAAAIGAYLAFAAIAIDVPVLIFDIGRPLRFYTLLFRGSVTAPLTWGTWLMVFLGGFSILNIALNTGMESLKPYRTYILVFGAICAVGVSAYTAVALNIATNARPIWSNGMVIPIFMTASGIGGVAAVTFFCALSGADAKVIARLNSANAVLLAAQLVMAGLLVLTAYSSSQISREAAREIAAGRLSPAFWLFFVIIGLIVPIIFFWRGIFVKDAEPGKKAAAVMSVMAIVGVFAIRYVIVYAGQIIPLT